MARTPSVTDSAIDVDVRVGCLGNPGIV